MDGRIWTSSNILSLVRVLLVVPIAILLLADQPDSRIPLLGLMVIAVLTDFFDGVLARKFGQVTEVGRILDPIADKIAVGVVAFILTLGGKIPLWFLVAVIARDALILGGGMILKSRRNIVPQSNPAGKWTVACITLYVVTVVLDIPVMTILTNVLLFLSAGMLVFSFVLYTVRFGKFLQMTQSS